MNLSDYLIVGLAGVGVYSLTILILALVFKALMRWLDVR